MRRTLALAFATFAVVATAFAQARLRERRVDIAFVSNQLRVGLDARDLADVSVRRSLGSGLQKHFAVTVQVFADRSTRPVASRTLSCRVVYDLWEESFVVRRGPRSEVVPDVETALARCLRITATPVADLVQLESLRGQDAYLAVRAEFNPISGSACTRSLRRPGGDDPLGPVVVNIVRDEICRADRAVTFRSQRFRVP